MGNQDIWVYEGMYGTCKDVSNTCVGFAFLGFMGI